MKNRFLMDCHTVMNDVYETGRETPWPILTQLRRELHLLFCPACAGELKKLRYLDEIMKADFFPPSPDFEEIVMKRLEETGLEEKTDAPAGFSFRGWVISGFFILLSLSSSFFGANFLKIAEAEGLSFLLPVGLTIGMVVTCYGALFIGSHLNELSARFRLR